MGASLDCCTLRDGSDEQPVPVSSAPPPRRQIRRVTDTESERVPANPGEMGDFYELLGSLGTGSSGSVARAVQKRTQAQRAIKTVEKRRLQSSESIVCGRGAVSFIENEVALMSSLVHPHIVRLYETFEDAESYHLVMEICTGGELLDHIVQAGNFMESQAVHAMQHIFRGVSYMHMRGICHRDLKPENFLCVSQDPIERNAIKIVDFGLSCRFKPGSMLFSRVGTAHYASPEVVKGRYDELCDLWSCGVILYVLLGGASPFDAATDDMVLSNVLSGRYSFCSDVWGPVSEDARALIRQLLVPAEVRLSAECALEHSWMELEAAAWQANLIGNLKKFQVASKLQKATLRIIADQMGNEKGGGSLRHVFSELDENGDGKVSASELRSGLERAGLAEISPELIELLYSADASDSEEIDFAQFLSAALTREQYEKEDVLLSAFRTFDLDGDGVISKEDFLTVLDQQAGPGGDGRQSTSVTDFFEDVDANDDDDGIIDFEKFKSMMCKGSPGPGNCVD